MDTLPFQEWTWRKFIDIPITFSIRCYYTHSYYQYAKDHQCPHEKYYQPILIGQAMIILCLVISLVAIMYQLQHGHGQILWVHLCLDISIALLIYKLLDPYPLALLFGGLFGQISLLHVRIVVPVSICQREDLIT